MSYLLSMDQGNVDYSGDVAVKTENQCEVNLKINEKTFSNVSKRAECSFSCLRSEKNVTSDMRWCIFLQFFANDLPAALLREMVSGFVVTSLQNMILQRTTLC